VASHHGCLISKMRRARMHFTAISPHALFAKIVPTKRLLAVEIRYWNISLAYSDEYLSTATIFSPKQNFIEATGVLSGNEMPNGLISEMTTIVKDLDVGGLVLISSNKGQDNEVDTRAHYMEGEMMKLCTSHGIPFCRWPPATEEDFHSESLQDAVEGYSSDEKALRLATAFSLAKYIRDVVGGWSNSFG